MAQSDLKTTQCLVVLVFHISWPHLNLIWGLTIFDFQAAFWWVESAAKSKKSFPDVWHREKPL